MSSTPDMTQVLSANRNVELSISLGDGKGFLVKVRGSDSWIKFAPAHPDSRAIAAGYHARVAGVGNEARTVDVAWLDNASVRTELESGGYLQLHPEQLSGTGARLECCVRAPPEGAARSLIRTAGHDVDALVDRAGNQYVRTANLPEAVRSDLSTLIGNSRRLDPADVNLSRSLERGEFRTAADMLARSAPEYEARLQRILAEELHFQRTLVEQRQLPEALARTSESLQTYGKRMDLVAQKALIEVESGHVDAASSILNDARSISSKGSDVFLKEMEHVMAKSDQQRIVDWVRWQSLPERSGRVITSGRSGHLTLELEVQRMPAGRAVQPQELDGILANRNAALYIQDRPTLSNIDLYSTPGRQSVHQLVATRSITVKELQMNDVAAFRPAALHLTNKEASFSLARAAETAFNLPRLDLLSSDRCREDDPRESCRRSVYVVSETRN